MAWARSGSSALAVVLALALGAPVRGEPWLPLQGEGTIRLVYVQQRGGDHLFSGDSIDGEVSRGYVAHGDRWFLGRTSAYTAILETEYGCTDRLAASVSVAFVATRYDGRAPISSLDDGDTHTTFQDLHTDIRYLLFEHGVVVTPVLGATLPVTAYERDGHAAPGRHLREARIGIDLGYPDVAQSFSAWAGYQYGFLEDIGSLGLARSEVSGGVGIRASRRVSATLGVVHRRIHGGLDWIPEEGGPDLHQAGTMDLDIAASASRATRGLANVTLEAARDLSIDLGWITTLDGANTEDTDLFTVGVSQGFGGSGE